jgi:hypothetical protein
VAEISSTRGRQPVLLDVTIRPPSLANNDLAGNDSDRAAAGRRAL